MNDLIILHTLYHITCMLKYNLKGTEKTWKISIIIYKRYNFCASENRSTLKDKKSAEGVIAPAGAKVTGATIRMWLLNKFISFLAVLTWKTGLKKNEDKGTYIPGQCHSL